MSARINRVRSGKLAEEMAGLAFNLEFVDEVGYDSLTRTPRRIPVEIRSRVEGTDGKVPRITLTPPKMKVAKAVIAMHFDRHGKLVRGVLVSTHAVTKLYRRYFQKKKAQSHIPWKKIQALPTAKDITASLRRVEHLV